MSKEENKEHKIAVCMDVMDVNAETLKEYRGKWIAVSQNSSEEDSDYMEFFVPEEGDLEEFAGEVINLTAMSNELAIYEDIANQIKHNA